MISQPIPEECGHCGEAVPNIITCTECGDRVCDACSLDERKICFQCEDQIVLDDDPPSPPQPIHKPRLGVGVGTGVAIATAAVLAAVVAQPLAPGSKTSTSQPIKSPIEPADPMKQEIFAVGAKLIDFTNIISEDPELHWFSKKWSGEKGKGGIEFEYYTTSSDGATATITVHIPPAIKKETRP